MTTNYNLLIKQLDALLADEDFLINSAQFSAFIFNSIADLNWAGFYLYRAEVLKLASFQGQIACTVIPISRGVCGRSFKEQKVLNIGNVHDFEGHIACDSASRSEVVVPLIKNGSCFGVFDIDSPKDSRFSKEDEKGIISLVDIFLKKTTIPKSFELE